jgi:type I restriction enzyme S subunit
MIPQAEFVEREGRRVVEVIHGKDNLIQVEPDDFVISMRSFQGGLEWCRFSGSTSFHYVPVTPIKHVVPRFFAHLLKSDRYISALRSTTNLIRDGQEIRYSNFVQVPLPIIPASEQVAIANFLDRETSKIDALIAEQQRLIELLQEKRQAVISHAVTKGLNPDAPMKDSGVEWLGEVPRHWGVRPLKYLANVQTGMAKGKDLEGIETVDIPYLRVANVQDGYLDLDEVHLLSVPVTSIERYLLKEGDVLMNEGGDFDKLGRGCIWSGEIDPCVHQNHVFAVRPHSISGEWLNAYTTSNAANSYFISRSKQSTNLASISSSNLMGLLVPLPPLAKRQGEYWYD